MSKKAKNDALIIESIEELSEISLGKALAILNSKMINNISYDKFRSLFQRFPILDESQEKYLKYSILSKNTLDINPLPIYRCESSSPYLLNNNEFFIKYLFLGEKVNNDSLLAIMTHLNNCIWCFDYFSDTIREYYNMTEILRKKYLTNK